MPDKSEVIDILILGIVIVVSILLGQLLASANFHIPGV
jgi:hypothetical protein